MMTVPMDSLTATASSSGQELADRLIKRKLQLESSLRKAEQSKVPSEPVWLQLRENYEAIILADHELAEKHTVESLLWRLHYSRIQFYRGQLSNQASVVATAHQGGNNNASSDRIRRLKSSFKSFLTEATGFYHELMTKISSKYGLSMGYFSKGISGVPLMLAEDEKRAAEIKKGTMSCHRCLIYLGDLARYKGTYGDGDTVSEFGAAESYYKQAAYLCPSSGNPHNQLATLATLTNDELTSLYRYFRGYVIEDPFPIARENLTMTFEKNRHRFTQLMNNRKVPSSRVPAARLAGRGRGRGTRYQAKDATRETPVERELGTSEVFKAFCTGFVRLNGILFTKTSLETFEEVFSSVINDFQVLLSSGPEEELNFGNGVEENALTVVRIVAILISSVYNAKESESYAEILHRTVLLQNAFTVSFKFVGCILKRCIELRDVSSCFFLPAVMVYIEWLACHPDVVSVSDMDEMHTSARLFFWDNIISFLNKLILTGLGSIDADDDETCFFDMGTYDERETGNRLALWEDSELRGFIPLVPAHVILDFSDKHDFGNDGCLKEKKARIQRILAAGKALANCVLIDGKKIYIDPTSKKFAMSKDPPTQEAVALPRSLCSQESNVLEGQRDMVLYQAASVLHKDVQVNANPSYEADEDEEIVFRPVTMEKRAEVNVMPAQNEFAYPGILSEAGLTANGASISSAPVPSGTKSSIQVSGGGWTNATEPSFLAPPAASFTGETMLMADSVWAANGSRQLVAPVVPQISCANDAIPPVQVSAASWWSNGALTSRNDAENKIQLSDMQKNSSLLAHCQSSSNALRAVVEQESLLTAGVDKMNLFGNGFFDRGLQHGFGATKSTAIGPHATSASASASLGFSSTHVNADEDTVPSVLDSIVSSVSHHGVSDAVHAISKKTPVGRPVRHAGPPPGFNVTSKRQDDSGASLRKPQQLSQTDDYGWLDGYQSSLNGGVYVDNRVNGAGLYSGVSSIGKPLNFTTGPTFSSPAVNANGSNSIWQDFHLFEQVNSEQNAQRGKMQSAGEQHLMQSHWPSRHFV